MEKKIEFPKSYKKNIEVTIMQENLLKFFENDQTDLPIRLSAYKWIFSQVLYNDSSDLTIENRNCLWELDQLIRILEDINKGF